MNWATVSITALPSEVVASRFPAKFSRSPLRSPCTQLTISSSWRSRSCWARLASLECKLSRLINSWVSFCTILVSLDTISSSGVAKDGLSGKRSSDTINVGSRCSTRMLDMTSTWVMGAARLVLRWVGPWRVWTIPSPLAPSPSGPFAALKNSPKSPCSSSFTRFVASISVRSEFTHASGTCSAASTVLLSRNSRSTWARAHGSLSPFPEGITDTCSARLCTVAGYSSASASDVQATRGGAQFALGVSCPITLIHSESTACVPKSRVTSCLQGGKPPDPLSPLLQGSSRCSTEKRMGHWRRSLEVACQSSLRLRLSWANCWESAWSFGGDGIPTTSTSGRPITSANFTHRSA
mmetsp:Transcript_91367/g.244657  ORF Transcript_91367/g.244657 Transcript_91367/m.244657 type:complete len:352 (-) Transcript_91367:202-1257(-)